MSKFDMTRRRERAFRALMAHFGTVDRAKNYFTNSVNTMEVKVDTPDRSYAAEIYILNKTEVWLEVTDACMVLLLDLEKISNSELADIGLAVSGQGYDGSQISRLLFNSLYRDELKKRLSDIAYYRFSNSIRDLLDIISKRLYHE